VSPTYESSGSEPSSFGRLDAAAAFSAACRSFGFTGAFVGDVPAADQQRSEICPATAYDKTRSSIRI
jgi:hypothetical protein